MGVIHSTPVKKGGAKTNDKPTYNKIYAKAQDLTQQSFIKWMIENKIVLLKKKKTVFEKIYGEAQDLTQNEFIKWLPKQYIWFYDDINIKQIYNQAQDLTQQTFIQWLTGTIIYNKANDLNQTAFKKWLNEFEK